MNDVLKKINSTVFLKCNFTISNFNIETESKEYHACRFKLNEVNIMCRQAKITPKKNGQFVTFWKRKKNEPISPFYHLDLFDFLIVNCLFKNKIGQFVFPKGVLIKRGIVSTNKSAGKRAFRVYPKWDDTQNSHAKQTQQWQLDYFYEIDKTLEIEKIKQLYKTE